MRTYIVGNWKMNFTIGESSIYLHKLLKKITPAKGLQIAVAPSLIALQPLSLQLDRKKIKLVAQNCCAKDFGAYTGETAIAQLRGLVDFCIVGHSERRYVFGETDKDIREKVAACIRNNITPILCVGETESERTFGETADVLRDQITSGLSDVAKEDLHKVIIAYEPVWAISSVKGARVAVPDDVSAAVNLIRKHLKSTFGKESEEAPILYGGSVSPSNCGAYLTIPGINGLLIGGSSLILDQFNDIIEIAKKVKS